jgi:tRNA modification GTPase
MSQSYLSYQNGDTVAAIATAPGESAIAIVRISGDLAIAVAEKVFSGPVASYKSHTAHYGKIIDANGDPIDHVLLLVMRSPKSYTGEDTVEIFCHGGGIVSKRVLERIIQAGARAARPGEYSFKAFMNGKLDLAQAEAVQELISAKNDLAWKAAGQQLEGALSQKISTFQTKLVEIAAILEAAVDFPEEDLVFATTEDVIRDLEGVAEEMCGLENTFYEGKILSEGLSLCLAGTPNVGKSSIMNLLLGKNRAIVTEIAGTTRDLLEEDLSLSGLHFRLMDTAGIRETSEIVEQEGIRRSKEAMKEADLVLLVLDASREISSEDQELLHSLPKEKSIVIWNKIDLGKPKEKIAEAVELSAKVGIGLSNLKETIAKVIWKKGPPSRDEIFLTKLRHKEALSNARTNIEKVIHGLKSGLSPEFASSDMREGLQELSSIIGTNVTEDILSSIFSKFCIGK